MSLEKYLKDLISGDEMRAEKAAIHLSDIGQDAISALLDLTRSPNADSRWWAVRALALLPHVPTSSLLPLLSDSSAEVRSATLLALRDHPDENAIPELIRLLDDRDSLIPQLAANTLQAHGKAAVPDLLEVVKGGKQSARIQALRALVEIRDHRAIPVMMKMMEEESSLLQYWAKEGLERLGLDMIYIKP